MVQGQLTNSGVDPSLRSGWQRGERRRLLAKSTWSDNTHAVMSNEVRHLLFNRRG